MPPFSADPLSGRAPCAGPTCVADGPTSARFAAAHGVAPDGVVGTTCRLEINDEESTSRGGCVNAQCKHISGHLPVLLRADNSKTSSSSGTPHSATGLVDQRDDSQQSMTLQRKLPDLTPSSDLLPTTTTTPSPRGPNRPNHDRNCDQLVLPRLDCPSSSRTSSCSGRRGDAEVCVNNGASKIPDYFHRSADNLFVGSRKFDESGFPQGIAALFKQTRRPLGSSASEPCVSEYHQQSSHDGSSQSSTEQEQPITGVRFLKLPGNGQVDGVKVLDHLEAEAAGADKSRDTGVEGRKDGRTPSRYYVSGESVRVSAGAGVAPAHRHSDYGSEHAYRIRHCTRQPAEFRASAGEEVARLALRLREDWYHSKKPQREQCGCDGERRLELQRLANQTLEYARKNPDKFRV